MTSRWPNLGVVAHDEVPELHDLVVDGGTVPLLDDVVGGPLLALLHHHAARTHHAHASTPAAAAASHHLGRLHGPGWVGGARLQLLDGQLVAPSSHHHGDGGQDVAAHQRLRGRSTVTGSCEF